MSEHEPILPNWRGGDAYLEAISAVCAKPKWELRLRCRSTIDKPRRPCGRTQVIRYNTTAERDREIMRLGWIYSDGDDRCPAHSGKIGGQPHNTKTTARAKAAAKKNAGTGTVISRDRPKWEPTPDWRGRRK